jgi:hypothetical protein
MHHLRDGVRTNTGCSVQCCVKDKSHTINFGASTATLPQTFLRAQRILFSLVPSVLFIVHSTATEPLGAVANISTLLKLIN